MPLSQISNATNMYFNAIRENQYLRTFLNLQYSCTNAYAHSYLMLLSKFMLSLCVNCVGWEVFMLAGHFCALAVAESWCKFNL